MASSSWTEATWQIAFKLGNEPLSVSASIWMWVQGEGGEDIQFFSDGTEESLARRL